MKTELYSVYVNNLNYVSSPFIRDATIEIKAKPYIFETKEDYIYVKAMMISGSSRNLPLVYLGVPIQIVVFSNFK